MTLLELNPSLKHQHVDCEQDILAKLLKWIWMEEENEELYTCAKNDCQSTILGVGDHRSFHFHNRTGLWLELRGTLRSKAANGLRREEDYFGPSSTSKMVIAPGQTKTWRFLGESLTYSSLPFEVSGLLPDSYAAATNNAFSWTVTQINDDDNNNSSKQNKISINNKADTLYLRELPVVMPGGGVNLNITSKSPCDLETSCVNSIISSLAANPKDDAVDALIESHPGLPLVLRRRLKGMAAKVKEGENMKSMW